MTERIIIGCMSGTSLDGIDAVKVKVNQKDQQVHTELLEYHDQAYSSTLQRDLKQLSLGQTTTIEQLLKYQQELGELHVELIKKFSPNFELIVLHGQTLFHAPPLSWQIAQPHLISSQFNCTCLYDLRMSDLSHGGQGAPISPLADALLFSSQTEQRAIINLGGFINITTLPTTFDSSHSIQGFDLCVCNQWLDQLAQKFLQKPYDENGNMANLGEHLPELSDKFYHYFKTQWQQGRSLGSQDDQNLLLNDTTLLEHSAQDILKNSCHALAKLITEACTNADRLILAGGGCNNKTLVSCIEEHSHVPVQLSDMFGIPFQQRESVLMALLGYLCLDKRPITLPSITGAQDRKPFLSGSWVYP